jgi:hypothetical protein
MHCYHTCLGRELPQSYVTTQNMVTFNLTLRGCLFPKEKALHGWACWDSNICGILRANYANGNRLCYQKERHIGQDIAPIRDRPYLSWCCGLAVRNIIKRHNGRSLSDRTPRSLSLSTHSFYENILSIATLHCQSRWRLRFVLLLLGILISLAFFDLYLVHMDRSASRQSYSFLQRWAWQFLLPMIAEMKRSTAFRRRILFIVWTVRLAPMPTSVSIMAPTAQHSMSTAAPSASTIVNV